MRLAHTMHHFAIAVRSLSGQISWYEEALDFQIEKRFTLPSANLEIVKLVSPGGVRMELLKEIGDTSRSAEPRLTAPGSKHVCFHVASIDDTATELTRRGIELAQKPKTILESNERNCWIRDPEGNMIEFIEELK